MVGCSSVEEGFLTELEARIPSPESHPQTIKIARTYSTASNRNKDALVWVGALLNLGTTDILRWMRAGKMTQWVKVLVTKSEDLSLILGTK